MTAYVVFTRESTTDPIEMDTYASMVSAAAEGHNIVPRVLYGSFDLLEGAPFVSADVLVLLTEWDEFRWLDYGRVAQLVAGRAIVDARNLLDPAPLRQRGFAYEGMGRS